MTAARRLLRPLALGVVVLTFAAGACVFLLGCGGGTAAHGGGIHARMGYSEERGLRVVDVPPGSTAERAGLEVDDRIVVIDGEAVSGMTMRRIVEALRGPPGSEVELEVVRGGEEETRTMVVVRAAHVSP